MHASSSLTEAASSEDCGSPGSPNGRGAGKRGGDNGARRLGRPPPAGGRRPAPCRKRLVFPAPLGPLTSKASPAESRKLKPSKTVLPPRWQRMSWGGRALGLAI